MSVTIFINGFSSVSVRFELSVPRKWPELTDFASADEDEAEERRRREEGE
jgi:hypothetical protein